MTSEIIPFPVRAWPHVVSTNVIRFEPEGRFGVEIVWSNGVDRFPDRCR